MFDTKVAVIIRSNLLTWQKLNVTAFLATGVAGANPDKLVDLYLDAAGRAHAPMLIQPFMVFTAALDELQTAHRKAFERQLGCAAYVSAMFTTGHDSANRAVFANEDPQNMDLVGLAVWGSKKDVDKTLKGLKLHE